VPRVPFGEIPDSQTNALGVTVAGRSQLTPYRKVLVSRDPLIGAERAGAHRGRTVRPGTIRPIEYEVVLPSQVRTIGLTSETVEKYLSTVAEGGRPSVRRPSG